MIRSYEIRLLPTVEQEELMWKHIGSCRFVWNWMLAEQQRRYESGEKDLSAFSMINLLKPLKNDGEHEWLYDVSNTSLQIVCQDLALAHDRFFKKLSGFPKFKSRKRAKASYPIRCGAGCLYFNNGLVKVEKLGKIRYKTNYNLPEGKSAKFSNARISFVNNKWILSFGMECENQAPVLTDKPMGIDLGIKDTAIVAFGDEKIVFHNINKSREVRRLERRLKHLQRNVSRKYDAHKSFEKTANIIKAEEKVRRAMYHLACIRRNYIHQCTHTLVSLLPHTVVMEDLNVAGMMKNRHLSKAIQQQCFYEFIRQMRYKCEWNGIRFVQVDRFYPSSKTCSHCGAIKHDLKLSERTYVCTECGTVIDRDYNAAVNLMKYGSYNTELSA